MNRRQVLQTLSAGVTLLWALPARPAANPTPAMPKMAMPSTPHETVTVSIFGRRDGESDACLGKFPITVERSIGPSGVEYLLVQAPKIRFDGPLTIARVDVETPRDLRFIRPMMTLPCVPGSALLPGDTLTVELPSVVCHVQ